MKSFYLGIDVSKGYADFMIIDHKKQPVIKGFQLDDTFDGHQALYSRLQRFIAEHSDSVLFAGMEATGGYENNWYNSLVAFQGSLDLQTARLNPLGVKRNSQADLKKNTTDKISAQNIAEYLVAHPEKVAYNKDDQLAGLRKQWGFIKMLTKQCTQFLNQLNFLMYTACPELLQYCQTGVPNWMLKLLVKYPGAEKLKKARFKTVAQIPYITENKAKRLINAAKRSVSSATDPAIQQLIVATAQQILHLKKTIDTQTKLMVDQCRNPDVELLTSFIGISYASAVGLMIEIQTILRFPNVKNLASFFGIHPVYKVSGDGIGGIKMSKQGRSQPRQILYMVALSAIQNNPLIKELYEYHVKQGKHNMAAMGICMHKILRIIYGMLKHNRKFDPDIDRANRRNGIQSKKSTPARSTDRRLQDYDASAPVSRRQRKKRRTLDGVAVHEGLEQGRSHNAATGAKCGITAPAPIGQILTDILEKI
jgi:transposase